MAPPVTVIGDLHLTAEHPGTRDDLFDLLRAIAPAGGTLVILGDLFDFWVGRGQAKTPFARGVTERLAAAQAEGLRLVFLAGNRDFAFDGAPGLALACWPDVVRARWGDTTVVMSHGDLLCTADTSYLAMRRVLRLPPVVWGLRRGPYRVTVTLAQALRAVSERHGRRSTGALLGIDYGRARAWLDGLDADLLVLGHVHTGVHHRLDGPRPRDVMVLRDWDRRPSAVVYDGGVPRLVGLDRAPRGALRAAGAPT